AAPRPADAGQQSDPRAAALAGARVAGHPAGRGLHLRASADFGADDFPADVREHGDDPLFDHDYPAAADGAHADQDGAAVAVQPEVFCVPAGVQREPLGKKRSAFSTQDTSLSKAPHDTAPARAPLIRLQARVPGWRVLLVMALALLTRAVLLNQIPQGASLDEVLTLRNTLRL